MNSYRILCSLVVLAISGFNSNLFAQQPFVAKSAKLKIKDVRSIASSASGVIVESDLFEGKRIADSELLVKIDSRLAELELARLQEELELAIKDASANADILFAEKSRLVAEADLNRAKTSNRKLPGTFPPAELDKLVLLVDKTHAEKQKAEFQKAMKKKLVDVKRSEKEVGQARVDKHTIYSPIDGVITEVVKRSGEWVEESEVIAKVVSLDQLIVEVKLPVKYAIEKFENTDVFFVAKNESPNGPKLPIDLYFIHPEVNPINSTIKVWFTIKNDQNRLFPGITGDVHLIPNTKPKFAESTQ